jgi:hypothetical protein
MERLVRLTKTQKNVLFSGDKNLHNTLAFAKSFPRRETRKTPAAHSPMQASNTHAQRLSFSLSLREISLHYIAHFFGSMNER